jgi:hypothetical protein
MLGYWLLHCFLLGQLLVDLQLLCKLLHVEYLCLDCFRPLLCSNMYMLRQLQLLLLLYMLLLQMLLLWQRLHKLLLLLHLLLLLFEVVLLLESIQQHLQLLLVLLQQQAQPGMLLLLLPVTGSRFWPCYCMTGGNTFMGRCQHRLMYLQLR